MLLARLSTLGSLVFAVLTLLVGVTTTAAAQPFSGTIFIDPDIITPDDLTSFQGLTATGQGSRVMFDRRANDWITVNAYLFDATFSDGLSFEIQVNPEFTSVEALAQAEEFAPVIGRLPSALRADVQTIWIHKGTQPFGGGNNNLLIHTGQADLYIADGILEETLVHEAAHTSLDATHASAAGWLTAQNDDPNFISDYARDNPTREDIAESFLPYLAVTYRPDRLAQELYDTIVQTIPNRIAYFEALSLDMDPISAIENGVNEPIESDDSGFQLWQNFPNPVRSRTTIRFDLGLASDARLEIIDALGRQVEVIESAYFTPGVYETTWNAAEVGSGVYVYRLQVGSRSKSGTMIVTK